ncbi:hypothetical protein EUTSA_v10009375mg [Eutrema salsugineum]|uniref:Plant thionin family protein n=1 Tax=Eutrema salsugineum TaxID=72664 RepID=V4MS29_EUTSA|nr:uncharacterized protein LOC18992744 [Eutrema salsugineum]ESQ34596.1 hypothetical protein EUTSA_v10009375mg [Eutrema salsugineum]
MAGQVLTKRCSALMTVMFFLVLFMAHVSHANTVDSCLKHCPHQCTKETKDATHAVCENACKKMCNEQQLGSEKYIIPRKQRQTIACRWMKFGCV